MASGLSRKDLERWLGQVGFVPPGSRRKSDARIAVKILGVNYAYGRWVFRVQPLAGTGSWQVDVNVVDFRDE